MYVKWQGMSTVEKLRADKVTGNTGDKAARYQE
jgi:hypothetical protein